MSTDKFAILLRAVNVFLTCALKNLTSIFSPVVRYGDLYTREQALCRLGVGDKTLKAWEAGGKLRPFNPPGSSKLYYTGASLIEFVGSFPRLDKTD